MFRRKRLPPFSVLMFVASQANLVIHPIYREKDHGMLGVTKAALIRATVSSGIVRGKQLFQGSALPTRNYTKNRVLVLQISFRQEQRIFLWKFHSFA
jgi:hypothetical protein